ncbi:MAG TPA: hypothetical protein VKR31_06475 [Rhizomicrobium sp.]|nr:hypothetical protein [Rhizomicrobium sp.]
MAGADALTIPGNSVKPRSRHKKTAVHLTAVPIAQTSPLLSDRPVSRESEPSATAHPTARSNAAQEMYCPNIPVPQLAQYHHFKSGKAFRQDQNSIVRSSVHFLRARVGERTGKPLH